jgi:hypothetical protein
MGIELDEFGPMVPWNRPVEGQRSTLLSWRTRPVPRRLTERRQPRRCRTEIAGAVESVSFGFFIMLSVVHFQGNLAIGPRRQSGPD